MKRSIIYATDIHLSDKGPRSRKDSYFDSICNKLKHIDYLSGELDVDYILLGGDVCHSPYENFRVFNWLNTFLKQSKKRWKTLLGQGHDWIGNWESTKEKTILYSLAQNGAIDLLGDTFRTTIEGVKLFASHQAILENPFYGHFLLYKDLDEDCDLVLTSHIHSPFPTKIVNGKTFLAPGSVSRNAADGFNWNRIPQCIHIEFENGSFKYIFMDLPCETDIFDPNYLIQKDDTKMEPKSMEQMESIVDMSNMMDTDEIIRQVGAKHSPASLEEAIKFKKQAEND